MSRAFMIRAERCASRPARSCRLVQGLHWVGCLVAAAAGLMVAADTAWADGASGETAARRRADFHAVRGRRAIASATRRHEGELHLALRGTSRVQAMGKFGTQWSGGAHLPWDGLVGQSMETVFRVETAGRYRLSMQLTKAPDYGVFSVQLNGKEIRRKVDLYAPRVELAKPLEWDDIALEAGQQKLTLTLVGANKQAKPYRGKGFLLGLDYLKLVRLDPIVDDTSPKDTSVDVASERSPLVPAELGFGEVTQLLERHCHGCHGGAEPEGELDLTQFTSKADFLAKLEVTGKIASALQQREMPPEDEEPLPEADRAQLAAQFYA